MTSHLRRIVADLAPRVFDEIAVATADPRAGVTRPPYDDGENAAVAIITREAQRLGLKVGADRAANLRIVVRGASSERRIIIGSHVDSVPQGGNYDGLAGVIAGLAVAGAVAAADVVLKHDLVVLGIRGEENTWFGAQHVGSRAALGSLPREVLDDAVRFDTGRSLGWYMQRAGADLDMVRAGISAFDLSRAHAYLELHIEQASSLETKGIALAAVSAIRGNVRWGAARCTGAYGHAGTLPREQRHDAVAATAEVIHEMNQWWARRLTDGDDLLLTFGVVETDAGAHGVTKVPGHVGFAFEARSTAAQTLDAVEAALRGAVTRADATHGVRFDLGTSTRRDPVAMDARLHSVALEAVADQGGPAETMVSGADHDAGDFADAGVPSCMVFVRNANGSHNPDEHLDMSDFALGTSALLALVCGADKLPA